MPRPDEWPAVGLADQRPPANLRAWLYPPRPGMEAGQRSDPVSLPGIGKADTSKAM